VQFLDRWFELLVLPVAIGGLHDNDIDLWRYIRVTQDRAATQPQVTGEQYPALIGAFRQLQHETCRPEDMAGVDKGDLYIG